MAKGYDTNQQRLKALSLLGKDLARRAKSKCELSGEAGVSLKIYEVEPVPSEPDLDKCLLVSEAVLEQLQRPKSLKPEQWRGLGELIWSEIPAQQMMAHRILSFIAKTQPWAQSILDEAYLDDAIIEWSESAAL